MEKIIKLIDENKKVQLIFRQADNNDYTFEIEDTDMMQMIRIAFSNKLDKLRNIFEKI